MLQAPVERIPPGLTHFLLGANLLSGKPLQVLVLPRRKEQALVLGSGVQSWDGRGRDSTEQQALSLLSVLPVPVDLSGSFLGPFWDLSGSSGRGRYKLGCQEECN